MATKLIVDSLQKTGGTTFTIPSSDGTSGQAIVTNGSGTLSFAAAGATITDDTSTDGTRYLIWDDATSGSSTSIGVSSTKLTWNPSSGMLSIPNATISSDLTVSGNLTVSGTTTTVNTTNLAVADAVIQCASGNSGATATYIGLQAERGGTDAYMVWEESSDRWRATTSADGSTHSDADLQCNILYGVSTTAQYADLAENYVSDNTYAVGTVLVFGGVNEVTISNTKEDKRIAGVVSSNPAYLMNSECNGEYIVPIALQGRVPCRVVGVVEKGDIIVSSSASGVGIAWNENHNPTTGSVIGKSLENKNTNGEEVIEVVVGVR
jgi:hypothetical protein